MKKITDMTALQALRVFRAKARCRYTQRAAMRSYRVLRPALMAAEASDIGIAWDHCLSHEGPAELDEVCDAIERRLEL